MYSSVKNIGQKEKKKLIDSPLNDENNKPMIVNAIAGGNKKKRKLLDMTEGDEEDDAASINTDDMSSDSEIDDELIEKALDNFKNANQNVKVARVDFDKESKNKNVESDEEVQVSTNKSNRPTKYVHVERREEIKVCNYFSGLFE